MARTKRARKKSTRRKSTRRKSTRRRTTGRKTTRRRTTRRAAARRTRARRPRRTTRRRRSKGLTRKSQKQILTVVAIVVGILILLALLEGPRYVRVRYYGGEVGRNAVSGQVTSTAIGAAGRGTIHVQSYNTGKRYTFYTGVRTDYNIRGRYPARGDSVKVYYVYDRGYLKATYVRIR
jgi:hypothetical protein